MSTKAFDYLLNAMEDAARQLVPAKHGYAEKRRAVLAYVAGLETAKAIPTPLSGAPRDDAAGPTTSSSTNLEVK